MPYIIKTLRIVEACLVFKRDVDFSLAHDLRGLINNASRDKHFPFSGLVNIKEV